MELLTGVICFLQIVELIFKIKDRIVTTKADQLAMHDYLNNIGMLLHDVAESMQNNVYPHDKCMQMLYHLNHLESTLEDKISVEQTQHLKSLISQAYQVERLFGELQNLSSDSRKINIHTVQCAAGAFIAAAQIVKL